MLALFFNDDRNIGANLAGDRFRREMEIRRGRDAKLNCTGYCPKFPVVVRAWISLHENASRGCMCLHVFCCAMNLDFATGGIRFDPPPGIRYANDARSGVHAHVAPGVRHRHTSGSGRYADIIANVSGRHCPAEGGKLSVALYFFHTDDP